MTRWKARSAWGAWRAMVPAGVVAAAMLVALAVPVPVSVAAAAAARAADADERYPVRDTERLQRSLAFTGAGPYRLEIDNVWGSIQVAAHDGPAVELTLNKTLAATTSERLEAARREVTLDVLEEPGLISFYVDGPFRDRDCDCEGRRPSRAPDAGGTGGTGGTSATAGTANRRARYRWNGPDYEVRYDFVLRVPRQIALALRTVNGGELRVEGTSGEFDVMNVNGGIEMFDIAGHGRVRTVNKDLRVVFRTNPTLPSSFSTVNGDVVVSFQPPLSATLRLKTFQGGLYTDFETTTALPALTPVTDRRDGKFVYKADRSVGVRVGSGGPELRFETLNGDVRILQRRK